MRHRFFLALSLPLSLLALGAVASGCGGGPGCGASFDPANIEITRARNSRTGAGIPRVTLRDFRIDGVPVTDLNELVSDGVARGVTVSGQTLECEIPCAFGRRYGAYRFTVSAPGYQSRSVEFEGGHNLPPDACSNGPNQVTLTLDPL